MISHCCQNYDSFKGTDIAYLTIHETYVKPGETQRRPGLHTETPGCKVIETSTGEEVTPSGFGYGYFAKDLQKTSFRVFFNTCN